jgi:hypothetical protein
MQIGPDLNAEVVKNETQFHRKGRLSFAQRKIVNHNNKRKTIFQGIGDLNKIQDAEPITRLTKIDSEQR